jgi:hypothetical protein
MKKRLIIILFLTVKLINAQDLLITNVNVIPVKGKELVLKNQNVFIKDGKISEITPFKQQPDKSVTVIDGTGKYLLPGLADMHVHFPGEKEITRDKFFRLNLAAGVTALRSMRGEPRHLTLRDSIRRKLILAPDLYISISLPQDSTVTASDLKKFVIKSKAENWDFIKYISGLTPALFDSAAWYCKQSNIKLAGHVYNQDLQTALKNNQASVEHYQSVLKEYQKDTLHFDNVIKQLKSKNIFICPTLSFYNIWRLQFTDEELKSRNGMKLIDNKLIEDWLNRYADFKLKFETPEKKFELEKYRAAAKQYFYVFDKVLKKMNDNNVMLLLSPDESAFNVPGFAMLEEMKLYKKAGLSNYAILKTATYNAACFFNEQEQWGSVTTNKKANLVLLDKNPLDDIENIQTINTVILNGKAFTPSQLLNN